MQQQYDNKRCTKCGEIKPLGCFSKRASSTDGHHPQCKECTSAAAAVWYAANKERRKTLTNAWYTSNKERCKTLAHSRYAANKERHRELGAIWKKEHPEKVRASRAAADRRYRNDPNRRPKALARQAVQNAIQSGKLTRQPCEVCGSEVNVHGHHDDYSKPLAVRWLCRQHHDDWHRSHDDESARCAANSSDINGVRCYEPAI